MAKKRVESVIECPKCKRNMRPWLLEEVDARPNANPPIPARLFVRCAASKCGQRFYVPTYKVKAA